MTGAGTGWVSVAWLMISDVVGTSVLTFAGVAHSLGYVLSLVFIVGLFPVSLFVSVLMSRTRQLLVGFAQLQGKEVPKLGTMGEVAKEVFQNDRAASLVLMAVYGTTLLGQSSYLLAMGTSFQQTFYGVQEDMCLWTALIYSCTLLLVPVCLNRKLVDSVWICLVNTLLIVVCIGIALLYLGLHGEHGTGTYAFPPDLSFEHIMGAMTNLVYSYAGQWMYFEIMDTMETPSHFPWAFAVAGPFMVTSYVIVALLGYYLGASEQGLLNSLPPGNWLFASASILFVHVVIVYVIKNIVLARHFHKQLKPSAVDQNTFSSLAQFSSISITMMIFGYLVANTIPFFDQLMGLIGGLCAGPINFLIPIFMYMVTLGRKMDYVSRLGTMQEDTTPAAAEGEELAQVAEQTPSKIESSEAQKGKPEITSGDAEPEGRDSEADASEAAEQSSTAPPRRPPAKSSRNSAAENVNLIGARFDISDHQPSPAGQADTSGSGANSNNSNGIHGHRAPARKIWSLCCLGFRTLPIWEQMMVAAIVALILCTMVAGVSDQIATTIQKQGDYGHPFDCHDLNYTK